MGITENKEEIGHIKDYMAELEARITSADENYLHHRRVLFAEQDRLSTPSRQTMGERGHSIEQATGNANGYSA